MPVINRPTSETHQPWSKQNGAPRKTAAEADATKDVYARFATKKEEAMAKYKILCKSMYGEEDRAGIIKGLGELGLVVDFEGGRVKYLTNFEPLKLDYNLCYVRHGKTEGNTEPRIFQGFCDYWENQLNETGKAQAVEAAAKMEQMLASFRPDLILCSPLGRAIETGEAFFKNHPEIPCRTAYEAREQQFGIWDNQQLRYMDDDDVCHLFYLDQNAVVKANKPHVAADGTEYASENFVELILRQAKFLTSVNQQPEVVAAKAEGRKANVLMYGHSMAGAAISVLLGHGKTDETGALGFDGKYIMPNATPTMLLAKRPEVSA